MSFDVQAWQMLAGAIILAGYLSASRSNFIFYLGFCYFLIHALVTAFWPNWNPGILPPWLSIQVQRNAGLVAILILLYAGIWTRDRLNTFRLEVALSLFIPYIVAADLIVLAIFRKSALLTWPTFAAGVYASILPMVAMRGVKSEGLWRKRFLVGLSICILFLVLLSGSSTGLVALIVGCVSLLLAMKQYRTFFVVAGLFVISCVTHKWDPNGRLELWEVAMNWWEANANPWLGVGSGAFEYVGIFLPDAHGTRYRFMHNDFMQLTFDTGLIGLCLFVAMITNALIRAFKYPEIFASLCAFCACSMFYFPLHFWWSQMLILHLFLEARRLNEDSSWSRYFCALRSGDVSTSHSS